MRSENHEPNAARLRLDEAVPDRLQPETLHFAATADDDTLAEINHWVERIERTPPTPGDYTEQDADDRELHTTVLNQVAITYWPDHATREICVR